MNPAALHIIVIFVILKSNYYILYVYVCVCINVYMILTNVFVNIYLFSQFCTRLVGVHIHNYDAKKIK